MHGPTPEQKEAAVAGVTRAGPAPGRPAMRRRRPHALHGWSIAALAMSAVALAPIVALVLIALFKADGNVWPHLIATVLPSAVMTTVWLMVGVGLVTLVVGTATAWLVTMYEFPGRRVFEWLLVVPLAVPTYLAAFTYIELWDYSGWVQTALRALFGWQSAADYWFPPIRSLGGAVFVMAFALYPYVYLTARASFVQQSICVLEASRMLGRSRGETFRMVALPLARPALAAGVTLALMECLNDIGAVQFFGVNTLTVSVYTTWLERSNLGGAAQIACVMLVFVLFLLWLERWSRRQQRFHHTSRRYRNLQRTPLGGVAAPAASLSCALPILIGFGVPCIVLIDAALTHWEVATEGAFWRLVLNSLVLSSAAALIAVLVGIALTYARKIDDRPLVRGATRLASVGYAVPGTVLAIGILVPLSALDNLVDGWARALLGVSTGLILTGSAAAIIAAYVIRFLAVSQGAIESGFAKVSPNLDAAARTLGRTTTGTLGEVHLPLLKPVLGAAAVLVFVDSMKELPATLLLRPFNFDTLATHIYTLASFDLFEQGALPALAIVAVGCVPIFYLQRLLVASRAGDPERNGSSSSLRRAQAAS